MEFSKRAELAVLEDVAPAMVVPGSPWGPGAPLVWVGLTPLGPGPPAGQMKLYIDDLLMQSFFFEQSSGKIGFVAQESKAGVSDLKFYEMNFSTWKYSDSPIGIEQGTNA
jgi:hypothetical protein